MKILKVKIKKQRTVGECHFEYPNNWSSDKISVLAYEDHPENLGNVEEACLCVTDEETAEKLLKYPEVQEITPSEANAFGRQWRPSGVKITDEDKVVAILKKLLSKPATKAILVKHLTGQEIDSLDENKTESGVGKGREFNVNEFI
ncbi:hypothetical protein ES703_48898 [subsurface metagenome]